MKKLWLDDIRIPPSYDWLWVRTYQEFVDTIEDLGLPDVISFDHDLGGKYARYGTLRDEDGDINTYIECLSETGYDCAKWLVDYIMNNNKRKELRIDGQTFGWVDSHVLPAFRVHSANPVGAENIQKFLNNFLLKTLRNNE